MGAYRSTYEFYVHPTRSQQYWEPTDYVKPLPPKVPKRKDGRPKRKRRRDATEQQVAEGSRTRLRRTYPDITCTRCGLTGHNSRGCHRQGVSRMPRNWVPPPPEETENGEQTENGGKTENVDAQPGLQTEIDLSQSAPNEIDVSQPRHPVPEGTSNAPADPMPTPAARGGRARRSSRRGTRGGTGRRGGRGGRCANPEVISHPTSEAPPLQSQPTPIPHKPASAHAPARGPAPIGYVIWPNAPTGIVHRPSTTAIRAPTGGYRPPLIRAPMFRPPRQSNPTPPQVQPNFQGRRSSPPPGPGPVNQQLNGGPMTFMPTPSVPWRP
ncbi:leucine-rich repeat extensin-like protein 5 [Lotus japonicus]|uniref:leucine-rich repeat extensin-like protein 5 n=1 Tax=Lotus japonicus TaxID=34305 RepID=UPI002589EE84|nr:leucine-rich repeat extensin-like protein 5 [Lotus japonicus]